ncbi:MAG TPA: response regulator transcription factor [Gammaproteobacteria bacterium]|nr:response regulator transcription factor [Gammaproteobacteria bacterium]
MSAGKLLIVEDDLALLRGLKDNFGARGYEVATAEDGRSGLTLALEQSPDLILLDVMLPKVNGYEICRQLRERGLEMPIVMLTARGQEEDLVLGLNLGADDYVVKPFRIAELAARVGAFLRRKRRTREQKIVFGDCELDLRARKLRRGGVPVELTAKEFRLLEHFATRPGCALSRDGILDAVWGRSVIVTPRSIDRCVATLRAKIETDRHRPAFIRTIRDIGYRFEPDGGATG